MISLNAQSPKVMNSLVQIILRCQPRCDGGRRISEEKVGYDQNDNADKRTEKALIENGSFTRSGSVFGYECLSFFEALLVGKSEVIIEAKGFQMVTIQDMDADGDELHHQSKHRVRRQFLVNVGIAHFGSLMIKKASNIPFHCGPSSPRSESGGLVRTVEIKQRNRESNEQFNQRNDQNVCPEIVEIHSFGE